MKRPILNLTLLLLAALLFWCAASIGGPSKAAYARRANMSDGPKINAALRAAIHDFNDALDAAMEEDGFPGAAFAVVKDGRMVYARAVGVKRAGGTDSIDLHTAFRVASLSKGFAPVLAGMLVDDNLLHWDDPIHHYVPHFQLKTEAATRQVTLRHVLSHSAGLPHQAYSNLLNKNVPYEDILPKLRLVKLPYTPGTAYAYQNVVYSLSGDVIEAVSGRAYNDLLAERIFGPLGMDDASTGYDAMRRCGNMALPSARTKNGYVAKELAERYYSVSPAAGINASITDMAQWMVFMLGHRPDMLSRGSLTEICSRQIDVAPSEGPMRRWQPAKNNAYGLGWRLMEKDGHKIVYHGGFVNGYRSELALFPDEDLGIVMLCNSANPFIGRSMPLFFHLYYKTSPMPHLDGDDEDDTPTALPTRPPAGVKYGN